jgi:hypothetical protein
VRDGSSIEIFLCVNLYPQKTAQDMLIIISKERGGERKEGKKDARRGIIKGRGERGQKRPLAPI